MNSSKECHPESNISTLKTIVLPTVYLIISVIGVFGNGLVIWLMIKKDRSGIASYQRSVTNLYILNLAVADMIFVGNLPFWAAVDASGGK